MIIAELIKELQKHPPELNVLINNRDDDGTAWLTNIFSVHIEPIRKGLGYDEYLLCREEDKEETALTIY